ncbi:hypothetical protein [Granulosicoccus antarcticus]|uniref:Uncharacterized protein n=1 Tax=Granulosicoccus antarcticus IMCC3135 TaxID=1192854 RepID=A0A2Z2P281_9GAMM|nr:hypothetical protein [Granulosicoccus antarcticus]ASJ76388.1 hypothetical protein IMCC3135_31705 [Granulosicoccus antarcticus IMCC3135]
MTDKIMALLALAVLIAYLGILFFYVPRVDLGVVIGATLLLVGYDFLFHDRRLRAKEQAKADRG